MFPAEVYTRGLNYTMEFFKKHHVTYALSGFTHELVSTQECHTSRDVSCAPLVSHAASKPGAAPRRTEYWTPSS